jgi:probable rRNA maturation factor
MNKEINNHQQIDILNLENIFINVSFVKDAQMLELNSKYKNKNYPTDVLSFNINEKMDDGKYYLGDIVVNIEQAQRQAGEYGNDLRHEIAELVEHGTLHLLGVHHEHDE